MQEAREGAKSQRKPVRNFFAFVCAFALA